MYNANAFAAETIRLMISHKEPTIEIRKMAQSCLNTGTLSAENIGEFSAFLGDAAVLTRVEIETRIAELQEALDLIISGATE